MMTEVGGAYKPDLGGAYKPDHMYQQPARSNNAIRPYKCEVCHRSFREVATLRKHEQLHRADRPYICTTCGKSFLWSSNLKVHERVHTGERPYKCKICHRCFTQSNDLRRHERNVHMRHKSALTSYKSPPEQQPVHQHPAANMAAYQALAMQQRAALLHQAMAYENMMREHNAAAAQQQQQQQQIGVSTTIISSTASSPTDGHPLSVSRLTNNTMLSPPSPGIKEERVKTEDISPPMSPASDTDTRRDSDMSEKELAQSKYLTEQNLIHQQQYAMTVNRQLIPLPMIQTVIPPPRSSSAMSHTSNRSIGMSPSPPYTFPGSLPAPMSSTRASPTTPPQHAHQNSVSPNPRDDIEDGMDLRLNKSVAPCMPPNLNTKQSPKEADVPLASPTPQMNHKRTYSDESDDKRHVTTTTDSPTSDDGFYHCSHCQVFFRDFTMFHLHESLHLPEGEDPFRCPSCGKHCQDRIEFNFHLVWHVRYPHTIPNYQPLQSYLMAATCSG